jgi:hypothetical protein
VLHFFLLPFLCSLLCPAAAVGSDNSFPSFSSYSKYHNSCCHRPSPLVLTVHPETTVPDNDAGGDGCCTVSGWDTCHDGVCETSTIIQAALYIPRSELMSNTTLFLHFMDLSECAVQTAPLRQFTQQITAKVSLLRCHHQNPNMVKGQRRIIHNCEKDAQLQVRARSSKKTYKSTGGQFAAPHSGRGN